MKWLKKSLNLASAFPIYFILFLLVAGKSANSQSSIWPKFQKEIWPTNHESIRLLNDYPDSIDLSIYLPEVGDQGEGDCCSAFAAVWIMKSILDNIEQSIISNNPIVMAHHDQFIYNPIFTYDYAIKNVKKVCGSAVTLLDCLQEIKERGVLKLSELKMNSLQNPCICDVNVSDSLQRVAKMRRIASFPFLNSISNESIIQKLNNGYPIAMEFRFPKGFQNLGSNGKWDRILDLKKVFFTESFHSVVIVGYNIHKGLFKIANSYGKTWGDNGYFYLPFDFFTVMDSDANHSRRTIFSSFYFLQNDLKGIRNKFAKLKNYSFSYRLENPDICIDYIIPLEVGEFVQFGKLKIGCFDMDESGALITVLDPTINTVLLHQALNLGQTISSIDEKKVLSISLTKIVRSFSNENNFILTLKCNYGDKSNLRLN